MIEKSHFFLTPPELSHLTPHTSHLKPQTSGVPTLNTTGAGTILGRRERPAKNPRDGQEQEEVLRRQGGSHPGRLRHLGRGGGAGQGIRRRLAQILRHEGPGGEVRRVSPRARVRVHPPRFDRRRGSTRGVRVPRRADGRRRTRGRRRSGRRRSAGAHR